MNKGGHLVVQGGHDLVHHLHDGHRDSPVMEVLGHLQADEAGSDDEGATGTVLFDGPGDSIGIRDVPEGKDQRVVDSRQGRTDRFGTRREEKLGVLLPIGSARGELPDLHALFFAVDGDHLGAGPHIHTEAAAEALRGLKEELLPLLDGASQVVGKATVGIGDRLPPFEEKDLPLFVHPSQTGGRRGASRDSAYDQVSVHLSLLVNRSLCRSEEKDPSTPGRVSPGSSSSSPPLRRGKNWPCAGRLPSLPVESALWIPETSGFSRPWRGRCRTPGRARRGNGSGEGNRGRGPRLG